MSNASYLVCSDFPRTYPSAQFATFDAEKHTIACGVECVPLLWLTLFRAEDLRTDKIKDADGNVIQEPAPVVARTKALRRLEETTELIDAACAKKHGSIESHRDALLKALSKYRGKYLTIELQEIAYLASKPAKYYEQFAAALESLAGGAPAEMRKRLFKIAELDLSVSFELNGNTSKSELVLGRLLGASHLNPVPWESVTNAGKPASGDQNAALFAAVEGGNLAAVRKALAAGANVEAVDDEGYTSVTMAAIKDKPAIVKALLAAGASAKSGAALSAAADLGHGAIVKLLLAAGADPNHRAEDSPVPLDAIAEGSLPKSFLLPLLDAGADLKKSKIFSDVCAEGDIKTAKLLLARGADPDRRDEMGRTGLMWAAWLQKWPMVKFLIEAGASKVNVGLTVRMLAATLAELERQQRPPKGKGKPPVLREDEQLQLAGFPKLLEYLQPLVDPKVPLPHEPPSLEEYYQFETAIRKNNRAKVESMLAKWPDIDQHQQEIGFAMHTAAHSGQVEMLKFFLGRGHQVGALNWMKNTPLHFAAQYNKPAAVAFLLKQGANPLAPDLDGDTPLSLAKGKVKAMLEVAAKQKS